jgi:hypothetical protein
MADFLYVHMEESTVRGGKLSSIFLKGANFIHEGCTLKNYLPPKGPISKYHHSEGWTSNV